MNSEQIAKELQTINAKLDKLIASKPAAPAAPTIEPASDEDLASRHGNPEFRFPLKEKWCSRDHSAYVGRRYSELPSWLLDAIAKYLVVRAKMARKEGGEEQDKKAWYFERDASRAMAYAIRNTGKPEQSASPTEDTEQADFDGNPHEDYDGIPFISNMTVHGAWWKP